MIYNVKAITCDFCRSEQLREEAETESEIIALAESLGWCRRRVENGAIWDCGPLCNRSEKVADTTRVSAETVV